MATRTITTEKASADGFINFSITGKDGQVHRFKMGIPLEASRSLDNAVLKNPAAFQEALKEGRVTCNIYIAGAAKDAPIDL